MKTLLIVDDNRMVLTSLKLLLKYKLKKIAKIETASSVADALTRLADGGVDLVLSDVNIGSAKGTTIKDRFSNVPIVYITGDDTWKAPDGSKVMRKTADPNVLGDTIKKLLGESIESFIRLISRQRLDVNNAVAQLLDNPPENSYL